MKTAKEFRLHTLDALKGKWGEAILVYFLYGLIGSVGTGSLSFNINLDDFEMDFSQVIQSPAFIGTVAVFIVIGLIISIAAWAFKSIVEPGVAGIGLKISDREHFSINMMFSYFSHWKLAISTAFLRDLIIFAWSLLCGIPGIIATYSYAMVPFILAENPELTASQVLYKSKEMMRGNRWRLFCLEMSFIGWILLSVLTCGLGFVALNPYIEVSKAAFYREISGTEIKFDTFANDGNRDFGI